MNHRRTACSCALPLVNTLPAAVAEPGFVKPLHLVLAARQIAAAIQRVSDAQGRSVIVALDGGSGAGKSTLIDLAQPSTSASVIHLDDFYTTVVPEHQWLEHSVQERLQAVFDWERLRRDVLLPLRAGQSARWHAFDFTAGLTAGGTYPWRSETTVIGPAPVVLLDGAYSASPPLADLIDLSVLVQVPVTQRRRRTEQRDGAAFQEHWRAIWDEVEDYYFSQVRPPDSFDLVITNEQAS